jgi:hypothetical protein
MYCIGMTNKETMKKRSLDINTVTDALNALDAFIANEVNNEELNSFRDYLVKYSPELAARSVNPASFPF